MVFLTQRDYAKYKGVSRRMVDKWLRDGKISLGKNKKIDRAAADKLLAQNHVGSMHGSNLSKKEQMSLTFSRTQREYYSSKMARFEYEQARGQLIEREKVKADSARTARAVRGRIMAIPKRLAGPIAAEQDQNRVYELLTQELTQALETISHLEDQHEADSL